VKDVNEALRELREGKNMSLAEATRGVCSSTSLSSYENGDTKDIQFGNLRGILENMRVSMSEFEYVLNGYQGSYYFELSKSVSELYQQRNALVLNDLREELEEKATSKHDKIFCLMIKRLLSDLDNSVKLSKKEIAFIDDFFFTFDHWAILKYLFIIIY